MPGTFSRHPGLVLHMPWCKSLTSGFLCSRLRGNVPGIPGACATRNFAYLVRSPYATHFSQSQDERNGASLVNTPETNDHEILKVHCIWSLNNILSRARIGNFCWGTSHKQHSVARYTHVIVIKIYKYLIPKDANLHVTKGQLTSCENTVLPSTCFRINIALSIV